MRISVIALLALFPLTAHALSIQYDGEDLDGKPASSVFTVDGIEPSGLILLSLTGGGPEVKSDGTAYISTLYAGSQEDPADGTRNATPAFAVFADPMLYIFSPNIYEMLGSTGYVDYNAYVLVLHFDGVDQLHLQTIYSTYYATDGNGNYTPTANAWRAYLPTNPVTYKLLP